MTDQTQGAVHVRLTGRVQGVGFREWTRREAERLGLSGWVCNRRSGAVEAVFAGPPDRVATMIEACGTGPALARVERLEVLGPPDPVADGFRITPTR